MKNPEQKVFKGLYSDYELIEILKNGRMASVWKGVQVSTGQIVAIKIYSNSKSHCQERLRKKLASEGIATKILEHDSICKVLDVFLSDDGHNGLVMEYLDGMDLSEFINRRNRKGLPVATALNLMKEVTAALDYAHNLSNYNKEIAARNYRRVLHQDIKPANIVVTQDNTVKLIDFGVSKIDSEEIEIESMGYGFTHTYAAPDLWSEDEEYRGDAYQEGHDLYSLGLVFFELLTGKEAFKTIEQARAGRIRSLSFFGEFPAEVVELFSKWTNKNPRLRFKNAKELSETISSTLRLLKGDDYQIGQEIEAIRSGPYKCSFSTVAETLRATIQNSDIRKQYDVFFELMLNIHLEINSKKMDVSISTQNSLKELCETMNIPHRSFSKFDDVLVKALYDVFNVLIPNSGIDWSQFKQTLGETNKISELLGEALSRETAYAVYKKTQIKIAEQGFTVLEQGNILFHLRQQMRLNSFKCDSEMNLSPTAHSLVGITVGRMLNKEGLKKESAAFLEDSFKFYQSEPDKLLEKTLAKRPASVQGEKLNISNVTKEITYRLLLKFAKLDNDICMVDRGILKELQVFLGDEKIEINRSKDMSIPQLLEHIPAGDHSFVFSKFIELVLRKGLYSQEEKRAYQYIVNYFTKNNVFKNFDKADHFLILDSLFKNFHKLKASREFRKELPCLFQVHPDYMASLLAEFNLLRPIYEQGAQITKTLTTLYEYIYGLERLHSFSTSNQFVLESYIYLNKTFFLKGDLKLMTFSSALMRSYNREPNVVGADFVYNVFKYYLKYKHVHESFFSAVLNIDPVVESEMVRIFSELKISRQELEVSIERIKINFNININLPSFRLRQSA